MLHFFDNKRTDNKSTAKLATKCAICDAVLEENSELDICSSCQNECVRIKKILDYLKLDNQTEIRTVELSNKTNVAEELKATPIKSVESVESVQSVQSTKPRTGTTVLGTNNEFYTDVLIETETSNINKQQVFIIRSKNNEKKVIDKNVYIIGNSNYEADFVISDNKTISRKHVQIINKSEGYFIMDVNSKNGTYLNGVKLGPFCETPILDGDKFYLSDEGFEFVIEV